MGNGTRWKHQELLIAMNLYCKLPFGQLDHRNPMIIEVAQKLGRTPSSLSMKLCNLASLDPSHQARGVKGLGSVSKADREIWNEFTSNWERRGVESEEFLQTLLADNSTEKQALPYPLPPTHPGIKKPLKLPNGPTETMLTTKARIGQRFFRQSVLASYDYRCCITGNPIPELLVASHILPWGGYPEHRLNPRNGLCLAQTQDAAFDNGLITFDDEYRLMVGPYIREHLPNEALERDFLVYEGKQLRLPDKFLPDSSFIRRHREEFFKFN